MLPIYRLLAHLHLDVLVFYQIRAIPHLSSSNNDRVSGKVDTDGQGGGAYDNLDRTTFETLFNANSI